MAHDWALTDQVSMVTGSLVLAAGFALPKNRTAERIPLLLANGITLGPLLMIVASPIVGYAHPEIDLLETVMTEGKTTILWAAFYASIQLIRDVL